MTKHEAPQLIILLLAATLLVAAQAASGQAAGTITGHVGDPSGAVIASAHVKAENQVTGHTTNANLGVSGVYVLSLEPGIYTITISAGGYEQAVQRNVTVAAVQTTRVDAILQTPASSGMPHYMHTEAAWMSQPTMTGDWNGARTKLNYMGITAWGNYVGESATMLSGGLQSGSNYVDDYRLAVDLDLGKLVKWKGANFHFNIDDRHGTSTSVQDIGNNKMNVQEIYGAGENRRFSELSFDQHLAKDFIVLKAGWYVIGNDYASTGLLCDLQNLAFCAHPQSLPGDAAWTDWPTAEWGFRVQLNLLRNLYLRTGIYEGNTSYKAAKNGMKFSFNGATGAVFPAEFGYTSSLGAKKLAGHYKLGAYFDTSRAKDQADPSQQHDGRYGGWLMIDQEVLSFEPGTPRGLYLDFQQTLGDRRTAPMTSWETAAAVAQGPFNSRKDDFISFGYARTGVNPGGLKYEAATLSAKGITNFPLASGEAVFEEGYGVMVTRWWLIHPNFQYVVDPGAFTYTHIPNPWVFGVQTKVTF
jgi:porin